MDKEKYRDKSEATTSEPLIRITPDGPYAVWGRPPLAQQFIMPNAADKSWYFQQGRKFSTEPQPTFLCRCGESSRKPYCDGTHSKIRWNSSFSLPENTNEEECDKRIGATLSLTDRHQLCTFARFCTAEGGISHNLEESDKEQNRRNAIHEATLCPGGRLTIHDNATKHPIELHFEPSLGLIEDITISSSGGLWVRGGIAICSQQGNQMYRRNRVVLCRCGRSENKPFCDGTHSSIEWHDNIEGIPDGETTPEEVY